MNKPLTYILLTFISLASTSVKSEMVCALDINKDDTISQNEIQSCLTAGSGNSVCPIQMLECVIPPPVIETQECTEGYRDLPNVETADTLTCPLTDSGYYDNKDDCDSICSVETTPEDNSLVCPLGDSNPCNVVEGKSYCSPNPCADNESDDITEIEDVLVESQPSSGLSEDGQCTGELEVFPGIQTGCREAGTQTRWDNCCNNGDKIIEDSYSNPIDNQISAYDTIAGLVDGALGTDTGGASGTLEDIAQATPGYHVTAAAVDGANWLFSPCARDSVSTSLIASGYCAKIGSKCTESWQFLTKRICVQRAQVHCCFNSLMAKTIHVQGRPQLPNMGWGTTGAPNCNGFTIDQFQALDFSKFDFTEYENELRSRSQEEIDALSENIASEAQAEFSE